MINHRMRSGAGTESSCSISSSGSLNSPKDFHEVKEIVKDISRRLDILEKIFVFVDLEQINQVIASFNNRCNPGGKAGMDVTLSSKLDSAPSTQQLAPHDADSVTVGVRDLTTCADWQSLPDGRPVLSKQPLRSALQNSAPRSSYPSGTALQVARSRLQPLEASKSIHSAACLLETQRSGKGGVSAWTVDLQDDVNNVTDDAETNLLSTGSTTAFASTTGSTTCADEDDIDPERYNAFMKQALQSAKTKQTWIDKVSRMREKPTAGSTPWRVGVLAGKSDSAPLRENPT